MGKYPTAYKPGSIGYGGAGLSKVTPANDDVPFGLDALVEALKALPPARPKPANDLYYPNTPFGLEDDPKWIKKGIPKNALSIVRGLGRFAGPVGVALTALEIYDMWQWYKQPLVDGRYYDLIFDCGRTPVGFMIPGPGCGGMAIGEPPNTPDHSPIVPGPEGTPLVFHAGVFYGYFSSNPEIGAWQMAQYWARKATAGVGETWYPKVLPFAPLAPPVPVPGRLPILKPGTVRIPGAKPGAAPKTDPATQPSSPPEKAPGKRPQPRPDPVHLPVFPFPIVVIPPNVPSPFPGGAPRPLQPPTVVIRPTPGPVQAQPPFTVVARPGSPSNTPPGKKVKERKVNVASVGGGVWLALNFVTEGLDFVEVLWSGLPDDAKTKPRFNKAGEWDYVTPQDMLRDLYDAWDDPRYSAAEFVESFINEAIEDAYYGKLSVGPKAYKNLGMLTGADRAVNQASSSANVKQEKLYPQLTHDPETGEWGVDWVLLDALTGRFSKPRKRPSRQPGG